MAGQVGGPDADGRARRLRERFSAASPQPAKPKLPKPPGANAPLVVWAVLLGLSLVYAIWKSL